MGGTRVRGGWRALLWVVATLVVVYTAFSAGVDYYDREHCGPEATDCDLGILWGVPWAAVALLSMSALVIGVEVSLRRRRR